MRFPRLLISTQAVIVVLSFSGCSEKKDVQFQNELAALKLNQGEITLCGSGADEFGKVDFSLSCSENIRQDFNLATALLHSFEYTEAEKVFAKVIEKEPTCIMAYWGAAMSNFHPLWAPPGKEELKKGAKIIALARTITKDKSTRESAYLEAIATIYDDAETLDHRTRVLKFEKAARELSTRYPNDKEAAIFYALALNASADPTDKTFSNQKKAGDILNAIFIQEPNHPGVAHYIIHNFDYPELASLALPAARKYASIAAASAHAQHMPSHIFTRLGLWDEAVQSNMKSVSAAQCYAENIGSQGHWDEELHGLDYLVYAYLQAASDEKALKQIQYLKTIKNVFPMNFKVAYSFAAIPARYALERRDWTAAARLEFEPTNFPWDKFPWERSNVNFARLLGAVHTNNVQQAKTELEHIRSIHKELLTAGENYKANLVLIQARAGEAWIKLKEGEKAAALNLMTEAADMEDATAKHPVTPGEIIPARELLGDMYFETGDFANALLTYKMNLERHPNRFNGLYGAAQASQRSGNIGEARKYYDQLMAISQSSVSDRPQWLALQSFVKNSK